MESWKPIIIMLVSAVAAAPAFAADEIHWTFTRYLDPSTGTEKDAVTFDWRGADTENFINYGSTPGVYTHTVNAVTPNPVPTSSSGPFWEAKIEGLEENTVYYYSIAGGPEHTFITPPPRSSSGFIVYAAGDFGSSLSYSNIIPVQNIIANALPDGLSPDFVLMLGDLTYADANTTADSGQHFNDVMVWSQDIAYMPVWGNHEWATSRANDNLNDFEGRFGFQNSQEVAGGNTAYVNSPRNGSPREDWYWFDYGNVRFVAYPEPYTSSSWPDWYSKVQPIMQGAQDDPDIDFIVTFGHRYAYKGSSVGDSKLKTHLDNLAKTYSKYVLNLCGHAHSYARTDPSIAFGATHILVGTGHKSDGILKLYFTDTAIEGIQVATNGTIKDSFIIGTPFVDTTPPTVSTLTTDPASPVFGTVTVSATATDDIGVVGVQFQLDAGTPNEKNLGAEDTTAPYSIDWDTTKDANGDHTLSAMARDATGNTATASITVTVEQPPDTTPPTVAMTNPADGATVPAGTAVAVSANADDGVGGSGVAGVQFQLDGTPLGDEDQTAPYSISWNPTAEQIGAHTLSAVARDAAGNMTTSDSITVTVEQPPDTTPPTVAMTNPADGATVPAGTAVAVSANADDGVGGSGVAGVQFQLDGTPLGDEDQTAPYSISWNPTAEQIGAHTLSAVARDAAGNMTTSTSINVTVTNTPPVTVTLAPVADSYVKSGTSAGLNFGTATALQVDNPGVDSLLMFNVNSIPANATILSATLSLYNVNASAGSGGQFYQTGNGWTETGVTYTNAPPTGALIASLGPVLTKNVRYTVDVKSLIIKNIDGTYGTYSLRIQTPSTDGADYSSKEATTVANRPQLIIQYQ